MTSIALGIPHTPWIPGRVETMRRLRGLLVYRPQYYKEFTDKEPNWSWSAKLWQWGLETGADYLLQLQDDVIVDGQFWPNLRAMLKAVPDQIIGLESVHPASEMLYRQGVPWYTTSDGLIGVGYVIARSVLRDLLEWRRLMIRADGVKQISEDTLIDIFCVATGRRVYHPCPTIIDHDVDVKSTYGNDHHSHRRPLVTTVRGDTHFGWKATDRVLHLGRFYEGTPKLARRWVKGFSLLDMGRSLADRG